MFMRLVDMVSKEQKENLQKLRHPKKKKEKFSDYDLRDLMGVNRDTYKRGKGGAIRRK